MDGEWYECFSWLEFEMELEYWSEQAEQWSEQEEFLSQQEVNLNLVDKRSQC